MKMPLRVLIVEDDFTSRILLQEVMSQYGACHIAVNGVEAVVAFQDALHNKKPYQLVFLDIMMPEMDGQETLKRIRAIEEEDGIMLGHGAKIIMQTAHTDAKNILESFSEMCDAYLVKPIQVDKLNKELKSLGLI
ncbi:MAG: response regulator [Desulfobacteraceae bacterium]|jgi:two-component system chemotaxis response regulator CheY